MDKEMEKVYRVTFSRSLAELILDKYLPTGYILVEMNFVRGNKLEPGQESRGLYGVVSTKKDLVLRVPMIKEVAALYCDGETRHIEEIFLVVKEESVCELGV
jgi:hypothetical protein